MRRAVRNASIAVLSLAAATPGCEEGSDGPDGPYIHTLVRHEDGRATVFDAGTETLAEDDHTTCRATHGDVVVALLLPTSELVVGEFELDLMGLQVWMGVGTSVLRWDGTMRIDAVDDRIEGTFEVEPKEPAASGVVDLEEGEFSCEMP